MIGSNTLIVFNYDSSYSTCSFGGYVDNASVQDIYTFLKKYKKTVRQISEFEAYKALTSRNCIGEHEKDYSPYAGDIVLYYDTIEQILIPIEKVVASLLVRNPSFLANKKKEWRKAYKAKKKADIISYAQIFEDEICAKLRINQDGKRAINIDKIINIWAELDIRWLEKHLILQPLIFKPSLWNEILYCTHYRFEYAGESWILEDTIYGNNGISIYKYLCLK